MNIRLVQRLFNTGNSLTVTIQSLELLVLDIKSENPLCAQKLTKSIKELISVYNDLMLFSDKWSRNTTDPKPTEHV